MATHLAVNGRARPVSAPSAPSTSSVPSAPELDVDEDDFFGQAVPRRWVHRAANAEVLLTRIVPAGADRFLVGAQWPRGHAFYRVAGNRHDPLILSETIRQTGIGIGHVGYDIPFGHAFIMDRLEYDIDQNGLLCEEGPGKVLLSVFCHEVRRRGRHVVGADFTVEVYRGRERVGGGEGGFRCVSPGAYARLRGDVVRGAPDLPLPAPVSPALVGRSDPADVVLAPTAPDPGPDSTPVWRLRCDTGHPILFDHPVDHVPGALIIEGMRQAVHHGLFPRAVAVRRLSVRFHRYADLDRPVLVRTEPGATADGVVPVTVTMEQDGQRIADGLLHASFTEPGGSGGTPSGGGPLVELL